MSAYCKGVCCRGYEVYVGKYGSPIGEIDEHGKVTYREGVKLCRTCSRLMSLDSNRCPCCKQKVSAKSRRKYTRKQLAQLR